MFKWLQESFINFEEILERYFSYKTVIIFEDCLVFLFGLFIGVLIMTFILSNVFVKSKKIKSEKLGNVSLIKFTDGTSKTYFINDNGNIFETMKVMLLIVFSSWFTIGSYTKRDEKRTKIFITILLLLGVLISLISLIAVLTITLPKPTH